VSGARTVVRAAKPTDAAAVADCVAQAYEHYIERMGKAPGPMLDDYDQVIAGDQVTVAESEGAVVGVLVLKETAEGLLLDNVAVLPQSQGEGIGSALIRHAECEAARQGRRELLLYTHETMTENLALYAKKGYVEYDRRVEGGFARVYMKKDVT
jgi:GNAT superfamily N-acetyltransferase